MKTNRIQTRFLILSAACSVAVAVVACWHVTTFAIDEPLQTESSEDRSEQNRSLSVLADLLIRNRDADVALGSALSLSQPVNEQSFPALIQVFEADNDSLRIDSRTGQAANVREEAIRLLKAAGLEAMKSWQQAREPFAATELSHATTIEELTRVERRFPFTDSGLRAALTSVAMLHLSGMNHYASARLRTLEELYHGSHLQGTFDDASSPIRDAVNKALNAQAGSPDQKPVQTNMVGRSVSSTIAPVWPRSVWSWSEAIDNYPNAPQPVTWESLYPFVRESFFSLDEFNNWRPILADGHVIHRTPLRIVALNVETGQEMWSVPTDTVAYPNVDLEANAGDSRVTPRQKDVSTNIESIRDMQAYGMISADDEQLYFLDGFALVNATSGPAIVEEQFGFQRWQSQDPEYPSRLVALRFRENDVPEVSWIAGATGQSARDTDFKYGVIRTLEELKASEPHGDRNGSDKSAKTIRAAESERLTKDGEVSLNGHVFLSPPCGAGDQLFVLTEFGRQTYVTCLFRKNGKVLWQRAVSNFGLRNLPSEMHLRIRGTCMLCDGVLCCVFHDGIIAGLRPVDGGILWATPYRLRQTDHEDRMRPFQFLNSEAVSEDAVIVPVANSSLVVAMHPSSDQIFAIEARTGHVRWTVSRSASGLPSVDGEEDHYIAGITESLVILIGEHHCRALDVQTGEQQWTIDTGESSGRAEVSSDRCLIPQKHGQLLTVDLASGRLHQVRHRFLPDNPEEPWGALSSSEAHVFLSTPVSVRTFLRSDAVLSNEAFFKSVDPEQSVLTRARLLLTNHADDEAIALLTEASKSSSDPSTSVSPKMMADVHRTLAEVILQRWADSYVLASSESRRLETQTAELPNDSVALTEERPAQMRLAEYSKSPEVMQLGELELDSDQQLRAAVLAMLSRPDFQPETEDLAELESFAEWSEIQPMTDDWSVRPDLLLSRFVSSGRNAAEEQPITVANCRDMALRMVQFPELMTDEDRAESVAQSLITLEDYPLAESMLLVWKRSSSSPKADRLLQAVRRSSPLSATGSIERGFVSKNIAGKRIKADVINSMDVSVAAMSWNTFNHMSLKASQHLPSWLPCHISISETTDHERYLNITDRSSGVIMATVIPNAPLDDVVYSTATSGLDNDHPALLPVLCSDSFEMLACTRPERASVLWRTGPVHTSGHRALSVDIEFGPILPECLIWYAGGTIHCTQTITGKDLWTRRMHLKGSESYVRGLKRLFGDDRAIVVWSEDNSRFERFRTRDGQSLGAGVLKIRANADVLPIGRFLIYPDPQGSVCVFDGETGQFKCIEGETGKLGLTTLATTFHRISSNRIVMVNASNELVIFDVTTAHVECVIPFQQHLRNDQIFSLTVFEQCGRLYVGVDDELDMHRTELDLSVEDLPTVRFGVLFHIDAKAGEVRWHQRVQNQAFVIPAGDPTDILVSFRDTSWTSEDDVIKRGSIRVQLMDGTTGKLISEKLISSRRPYRIAHFASEEMIEMVSAETVTRLRMTTQSDASEDEASEVGDLESMPEPGDQELLPKIEAP